MRRFSTGFMALLAATFAFSASADLEDLAPETAREQVGASEGVVVVDLFAEW